MAKQKEDSLVVQANAQIAASVEAALIQGDLSKLTVQQRLDYYKAVCESLSLNPLTKPFGYITFKTGELKLYALKDCTEQLRARDGISIGSIDTIPIEGCVAFKAMAYSKKSDRQDSSVGVVATKGLTGNDLANAVMKAETKAKRRVTLSICGLGLLDESEIHSIEGARIVDESYAMREVPAPEAPAPKKVVEEPKSIVANYYLYDTKLILDETKRQGLQAFFTTNKVKDIGEGVFASPKELKRISELLVGERNEI